jgi:glycosyltransferase involved in cell wall biosynthesis
MTMRIAFVVTGGVDRTGREHVVPIFLSLIERLARRHDLHVYVLRYLPEPATYPLHGATIFDLGRPEGLHAQHRALMAALRRNGPYDILHGYWAVPAGIVTAIAGRRLKVPSVVTCDSGEFVGLPDIDYGLQLRLKHRLAVAAAVRLATKTTVCSRFQERLARASGACPDVVPVGVDTGVFTPCRRAEGPPWRLLHVGDLNPVKDQTTLLDALRLVADREDVHLDVVGVDTMGGSIQAYAERLGLSGHVTFHGFQPTDALILLYRRAHLLVLSSRHEAAGVVTLEAAACGVPTVGTRVGYVADWAPDAAVAVDPGNAATLADAITHLLADAALRQRVTMAARAWSLAHDADWSAQRIERLYLDLVRPRSN